MNTNTYMQILPKLGNPPTHGTRGTPSHSLFYVYGNCYVNFFLLILLTFFDVFKWSGI